MKRLIPALLIPTVLAVAAFAVEKKPEDAKADRAAVVQGDTQFALDLYAKVRGQDGNLFFSPYSISTALAMTRAGAKGETAAQMDKVMYFTLPQDKRNAAFAGLIQEINGDPADKKRGYQLSTANALWGQKDYGFYPDFLKLVKEDYGAGLSELDFKTDHEGARKTINSWVEKQTNDKIKDLLHEGDLTDLTRLVLTNAIYFKGNWVSQFKKDATTDAPFQLGGGKTAKAPLMFQTSRCGYMETAAFQALEMPYGNGDLSMVVLLPKKVDGLADLEKDLTADKLAIWTGKLQKQDVLVWLPRFKTEQRVELTDVLASMGMPLAFDDQRADLSGMAGKPGDLHISKVIHQAYIDVNEEGTEAAGATAVVVAEPTAVRIEPPKPTFRADHPFIFLIRDTRSGSVLFLGRLTDPTK
ncbi:MAG TPA: serpin family protein [Gemmataceae bacterium]|nr:serpin family protein [Gemmataceae bacterium]